MELTICNVVLAAGNNQRLCSVFCKAGKIDRISTDASNSIEDPHVKHIDGRGGILLPS